MTCVLLRLAAEKKGEMCNTVRYWTVFTLVYGLNCVGSQIVVVCLSQLGKCNFTISSFLISLQPVGSFVLIITTFCFLSVALGKLV